MVDVLYWIGKSAKYLVSCSVGVVLLFSSSLVPFYYVVFAVISSILGKILKDIIKQPRPIASKKRGYGMPSSHTSALAFFITISCIKGTPLLPNLFLKAFVDLSLVSYGILACIWRIQTQLHTGAQILAGAIFGLSMSLIAVYCESFLLGVATPLVTTFIPNFYILKLGLIFCGFVVVFWRNLKYFLLAQLEKKNIE